MSFLVDTDLIINGLHGRPEAVRHLEPLARQSAAVSVITLGELYEGAFNTADPQAHIASLHEFLSGYTVLNLSEAIMQRFGQERAALRRQGRMISDLDLLIASTALAHNLTLVTRNVRHFDRIPGLAIQSPEPS